MAKRTKIDELNILNSENVLEETSEESFDYNDYIEHYFDPMQISERQKRERIEEAEELFDAILLFLIWCEENPENVQREDTKREMENLYKEVIFQKVEPDDFIDIYVQFFIGNLVDVTTKNQGDEYFTSIERAINIACNEANSVVNYSEIQTAKKLGYSYKQWIAELDERTRIDHIGMNGNIIPIDAYFVFDDCEMLMPHDEVNGTAKQCANCRCTLQFRKDALGSTGAISGAYNDINDPYDEKRSKIANDLYTQIKNRKREFEVGAVARNSGMSIEEVNRVYEHIFTRQHLFEDGTIHLFDPDYYMAHSWIRLRTGLDIQEHDLMLLKHELEEEKIMGDSLEIPYEIAHNEVEIKGYSYIKLLIEYLKTHDV